MKFSFRHIILILLLLAGFAACKDSSKDQPGTSYADLGRPDESKNGKPLPPRKDTSYPYILKFFPINVQNKHLQMAYMDVPPTGKSVGKAVLLLHSKSISGAYWEGPIRALTKAGYRVIVPDQIGFGLSSRPDLHYSFHLLAENTRKLLDSLRISKVTIVGHGLGGMLGVRFALMYPQRVVSLVLENPTGLEDYRKYIPYLSLDEAFEQEKAFNSGRITSRQAKYYPSWKPEYRRWTALQSRLRKTPSIEAAAYATALTYLMTYEQPVCYEFGDLRVPVLLIIGTEDRTRPGRKNLPEAVENKVGQFQLLGKKAANAIPNARLIELSGIGHIPHIQVPDRFNSILLDHLRQQRH